MRGSLAAVGVTAAAVACCGLAPVLIGAVGGLTLAAVLGSGALAIGVILLAATILARRSRRTSPDCSEER